MGIKDVTRFDIQRKIVANMTTESWQNIPHVSYLFEPDVTKFIAAYKEFDKTHAPEKRITLNTVILKAIAVAIKADPQINAHLQFESKLVRGKLTVFDNIDISVPWTLPDGNMMTITLKDMGNRSLREIADYTAEINRKLDNTNLNEALYSVSFNATIEKLKKGHVLRAVQRLYGSKTNPRHRITLLKGEAKKAYEAIPDDEKITYKDLKQGTITVSNIGALSRDIPGSLEMLMIIPPQICAIGLGAMQKRPIVVQDENGEDKVEIRTIFPMCVCFDHRALDFGEVKPFLAKLNEIFDNPEMILDDDKK